MSTVAVYDYDFFNYEKVIPNLECAKIITYYRNHKDIALLIPTLKPAQYTKCYVRKEYEDGIYPREIFLPNCEYGGRAFNPEKYKPLDKKIENTIPNMHVYDRYVDHFGRTQKDINQIKRILNCAHMRLAPDSQNLLSFETLQEYFKDKVSGIFLHDYDLASLKAYDLIKRLQDQREFKTKLGVNPYPVGNKYPIKIYSSDELQKWLQIVVIPEAFFLEYYGLMSDKVLNNLCLENRRMARQVYYNITWGCSSENDFFINRLPKILFQTLFLRRSDIKILLTYEENFFVTKELENLVELLNCWLSFTWQEDWLPARQTLYNFCYSNAHLHYTNWAFQNVTLSVQETRDIFQYVRENNYDLFKLFYEIDYVIYKGGRFVDGWE